MKKKEKTVCQIIRFRGKIEAFLVSIDEFAISSIYKASLSPFLLMLVACLFRRLYLRLAVIGWKVTLSFMSQSFKPTAIPMLPKQSLAPWPT